MEAGDYGNGYRYVRMREDRDEKIVVIPGVNDEMARSVSYPLLLRYHFRGLKDYSTVVVSRNQDESEDTEEMAEQYRKVMEEEGPAHVLGVSMGGMIAQHLAVRSERVKKLIIGCSGVKISDYGDEVIAGWLELLERERYAYLYSDVIEKTMRGRRKHLYSRMASRYGKGSSEDRASDIMRALEACRQHDTSSKAQKIENKTLVIGGRRDDFFTPEIVNSTSSVIGAETKYLEGGHASFVQNSSDFHDKVLRFLSKSG